MKEYIIYEDENGNKYVKGNIGGGYTISECSDKTNYLWDYSSATEEDIAKMCKNTGEMLARNDDVLGWPKTMKY